MTQENKTKKLKIKIYIIISIVMIIGTITRVTSTINTNKKDMNREKALINTQIKDIFEQKIKTLKKALLLRGNFIVNEHSIKEAFKNGDRKKIYKLSYKRYNNIQAIIPELNTMHFHTKDHKSFLRVHMPDKYGDSLKESRPMITKTIKNKKTQIGFEYGVHQVTSIPMYRLTFPIFDNNDLMGVLEFGVDLSLILKDIEKAIANILKIQTKDYFNLSFILYENKFLNKNNLNKVGKFYQAKDNIFFKKILELSNETKSIDKLIYNNKEYELILDASKLMNYLNQPLGAIIYTHQLSEHNSELKNNIIFSIVKPMIILIIFLLLFNWVYNYLTKELYASNKTTQDILDSQESIIVMAHNNKIIKANSALFKFFGFKDLNEFLTHYDCVCDSFEKSNEKYLTKQMGDISWEEYIQKYPDDIHKAKIKDKNGRESIFKVDLKIISKEDIVITFTDITELEKLNKNLEKQVIEKTQEIERHNQSLELKVKEEVAKNRQKEQQLIQQSRLAQMGEMISMIAHQWRQPLTAISATTNNLTLKLMMDDVDKQEFEEEIGLITDYTKHLSSTIDDFRSFFKENKQKEEITFDSLVNSTLDIIKTSLENKNINIKTDLNSSIQITTYPNEIKQVILNLIKNAQDALIDNHIKRPIIVIETKYQDGIHKLSVKDNAGGIPEYIIDKIFDPYFSTKKEKDGTGLGLYMSKTIIEDHCGGKLSVKNNTEGAFFTIVL